MIIVTRPSPYGEELVQLCLNANLAATHLPFFKISKGKDFTRLQQQLDLLTKDDIVIVVSPQVILMLQHVKIKFPEYVRYFAIGKQTAQHLQNLSGKNIDYPKCHENSEGLIHYFQSIQLDVKQRQVLILSGDISRTVIQNELINQGAFVKNIYCYQRDTIVYPPTILADHQDDHFIITSIEHLLQLEHYSNKQHKKNSHIIVSSEKIFDEAKKRNWRNIYLANSANNQNLFKTIVSICHNGTIN